VLGRGGLWRVWAEPSLAGLPLTSLHFSPEVPLWVLAVLGTLAVAVVALALLRRAGGAWLRAAAFAVLLAWLAGPRLVQEVRDALPDIGLLVVDHTASMAIDGRLATVDDAARALQAQAAKLPGLELRTVAVPEGRRDGTRLFAALDRALADIPRNRLAGIVALSDGQAHDVPAGNAGFAPAPLHLLLPAAGPQTDRRLRVVGAPSYGVVGRDVAVRVVVEDLGAAGGVPGGILGGVPGGILGGVAGGAGGTARLTVRRDGEAPVERTVPVGVEQDVAVPIAQPGPTVVELEVSHRPGEISDLNNRVVVPINGVRDRLRVLLVSGEPNQGERVWRRLLKADPSVDLVHFTILRPPEKDDMTPLGELALIAFPTRELFVQKIAQFDLIILDRFQNRGILPMPYLRNIADYVRGGGGLLLSVGPEFVGADSLSDTPLAEVLPARAPDTGPDGVVDGSFRPRVTALGERHPVTEALPGANAAAAGGAASPGGTAAGAGGAAGGAGGAAGSAGAARAAAGGGPAAGGEPAWGPWYRAITPQDPHGQVLMSGPDNLPLLLLDRVEQGRAAMLMSDQIWLWARGHEGGGPQAELLRRLAHWLMKEPGLEEEALEARIDAGRLTVERRSLAETPTGQVTVTAPDGTTQTVALAAAGPGRAVATLDAAAPGVWAASDGTRRAFAAAEAANPQEEADLRASAERMAPLLRQSGGGVHLLRPGGAPELRMVSADGAASGAGWIGLRRRDAHLVTGVSSVPLLPAWAGLPLLLGLVLLAWRREGR
jgi:hypothetical protein